ASASDLAADLDRFLAGEPIRGRPLDLEEEFRLLRKHRPLLGLMSQACAWLWVVAIGAGFVGVVKSAREGAVLLPLFWAFNAPLLGWVRYGKRGLILGVLVALGVTGGCLLLVPEVAAGTLASAGIAGGLAAWLVFVGRCVRRWWGRTPLETLP